MNFVIREYEPKYSEDVKDLLLELQKYLVSLDESDVLAVTDNYREKYFEFIMAEMSAHSGKLFVADVDGKAAGIVTVKIFQGGGEAEITTNCPKIGFISDIFVKKDLRGSGIGRALIGAAEDYFSACGCKFSELEVSASNMRAFELYQKLGYAVNHLYLKKPIE